MWSFSLIEWSTSWALIALIIIWLVMDAKHWRILLILSHKRISSQRLLIILLVALLIHWSWKRIRVTIAENRSGFRIISLNRGLRRISSITENWVASWRLISCLVILKISVVFSILIFDIRIIVVHVIVNIIFSIWEIWLILAILWLLNRSWFFRKKWSKHFRILNLKIFQFIFILYD